MRAVNHRSPTAAQRPNTVHDEIPQSLGPGDDFLDCLKQKLKETRLKEYNRRVAIYAERVQIPVLSEKDAVERLRVRLGLTEVDVPSFSIVAGAIVSELSYFTLAIDHAAAFIRSLNLNITEFLPTYNEFRKEILSRVSKSKHAYPDSVAVTFLLSFDQVKRDPKYGRQASKLLQLLVFLNPNEILIDFLRSGSHGLSEGLADIIDDRLVFHESLGLLQQFSLIGRSPGNGNIVIHRLIQEVVMDELSKAEVYNYLGEVIGICTAAFPKSWDTKETLERCKKHRGQVVESAFEASKIIRSRDAGVALALFGLFLKYEGKVEDSEPLTARSCEIMLKLFGNEHRDTLACMYNLAAKYECQGKLEDVADLEKWVLKTERRTLGDDDPKTLMTMNNLATTYECQGKLEEAVDLTERVVEAERKKFGEEHPYTLTSMNNLAASYWKQGRLRDAIDLQKRVLETSRSTPGEEHPDTLQMMNNLAFIYRDQGRLQEAADLLKRVLEATRRTLGEEHPRTLGSTTNLAWTYEGLGRGMDAMIVMQKSVDGTRKTLGEEHSVTEDRKRTLRRLRNNLIRDENAPSDKSTILAF